MSSLGIMRPKKRREIEGVSSSSIIDLKASLFQAEEEVSRCCHAPIRDAAALLPDRQGPCDAGGGGGMGERGAGAAWCWVKRAKASGKPLPAKQLVVKQPQTRNKGVEERAQRDQIALEQQLNPTESLNSKMQQYNAM
eukprot:148439-Hanusia_phi.AAC.1